MNSNTHTSKRLITGLVLAVALSALTVPSAVASGNSRYGPHDGWYSYAVSLTKASQTAIPDGRSPDTKDAGLAAQQQALAPVDGRSPDTLDAAQTAQAGLLVPADGRSPDTIDAAVRAHTPVVTITLSPGFATGATSGSVSPPPSAPCCSSGCRSDCWRPARAASSQARSLPPEPSSFGTEATGTRGDSRNGAPSTLDRDARTTGANTGATRPTHIGRNANPGRCPFARRSSKRLVTSGPKP
jgi:hypothetical protein